MPDAPVTTLIIFSFHPGKRWWAFTRMAFARLLLRNIPRLLFHKLMGTGRGLGFTLQPDWGRYAFLGVWQTKAQAEEFLKSSQFIRSYRKHAFRIQVYCLTSLSSYGSWNGANPFEPHPGIRSSDTTHLAVLTRATIRPGRLRAFWQQVQPVREQLEHAPGLMTSIGMGEAPFIRQATFSVWESENAMKQFAYGTQEHQTVIERARHERWYSEDLFARFAVIDHWEEYTG